MARTEAASFGVFPWPVKNTLNYILEIEDNVFINKTATESSIWERLNILEPQKYAFSLVVACLLQ